MSIKLIDDTKLSAIGNAIRTKGGTSALIDIDDMPQAIADLPSGGGGDPTCWYANTPETGNVPIYNITPVITINTSGGTITATEAMPLDDSSDWGVSSLYYDGSAYPNADLQIANSTTDGIHLSTSVRNPGSEGSINWVELYGTYYNTENQAFERMYNLCVGGDDTNFVSLPGLLRSITHVSGSTYTFGYNGGSKTVELSDGEDGSDGFIDFTFGTPAATGANHLMNKLEFCDQPDWLSSVKFVLPV